MPLKDEELKRLRVRPGRKVKLDDYDTKWGHGGRGGSKEKWKDAAEQSLEEGIERLRGMQEALYASDSWSVLIIFQARDAAGKDSAIKHVMGGINPQGCQVFSFKHPSTEELDHDYMWRYYKALPERGRIGIFNRSYYEEVLVVRVHPELLTAQRIPGVTGASPALWKQRYEDINQFEEYLTRNGTLIIKFFLHLSWEEQRDRFLKRIEDKEKHWKFSSGDLVERGFWDDYTEAYEDLLSATSTDAAPWYVLPADHKWMTHALAAEVICNHVGKLPLAYPKLTSQKKRELDEAKAVLLKERRK